jgi:tetratricopeptide (TPR) repeat protein
MKKLFVCVGLVTATLLMGNDLLAQSKNVQDAFSKFKMVSPKNDAEKNLRILDEAKTFIDAAADNAETKEDPKMHFYRAQIYMSLYETGAQQAMLSGNADQAKLEGYKNTAATSFLFCLNEPKKKYQGDVKTMVEMKYTMFFEMGVKSYNEKQYEQALMMFFQAYDVKTMVKMEAGEAKNNAIISLNQIVARESENYGKVKEEAINAVIKKNEYLKVDPNYDTTDISNTIKSLSKSLLEEEKKIDNVINVVEQIRASFPKDVDILITLINLELKKDDLIAAEKYMSEAVSIDPNNKVLHYNLGTSYMTQGLYEKAEASLNKALEIDPAYKDAQYQLGAHLYNWANEVKAEAGQLNSNDPKVTELENQSDELLKKALVVLEKYIEINPKDKDVLGIIYKTYYKLGNAEKGKEYKARFDAKE